MTITFRQEIKNALDDFYGELEGVSVPRIMAKEHEKHTDAMLKLFEKYYTERKKQEENEALKEFVDCLNDE